MSYPFPIILASASPRRKELLSAAGHDFKVVPSSVDESAFAQMYKTTLELAEKLALAKAKDVAEKFPEFVVIGADTLVDFEGEVIGKPASEQEAEQIIRKLFSKPHKVITGLAIVRKKDNIEIVSSDTTVVFPKPMTDSQIAGHIKGKTWQGKAGAYGIQQGGDEFIDRIEGSYTNVMGFPMQLVDKLLKKIIP